MESCVWIKRSCGLLVEACSVICIAFSFVLYKLVPGFDVDYAFTASTFMLYVAFSPVVVWYFDSKDVTAFASEKWSLIFRAFLTISNMILTLMAVQYVSISDTFAIAKCSPLITALLGFLIYKERLGVIPFVFLACSVVGAMLICRPDFIFKSSSSEESLNKVWGLLLAVGSSLSVSLSYAVCRGIRKTPVSLMAFFVSGLCTAIFIPVIAARESWKSIPCGHHYAVATTSRVVASVGFGLRLVASRLEDVSRLAVMFVIDLPFVIACEVILMGVRHPWTSYVGVAIVVVCVTMSVIIRSRNDKPSAVKDRESLELNETELNDVTRLRLFKETVV